MNLATPNHEISDDQSESLNTGLLTTSDRVARRWRRSGYMLISVRRFQLIRTFQQQNGGESSSLTEADESTVPADKSPFEETSTLHTSIQVHEEDECEILHKSIARIVEGNDLFALRSFGGVEGIAFALWSNLDTGLGVDHGGEQEPGAWDQGNPSSSGAAGGRLLLHFFLEACNTYTVFLLLISAVLCFATQMKQEGPEVGWREGATVLLAVFFIVTVPSGTNFYKAKKLEREQLKEENKLVVNVVRGDSKFVTISDVVMGDIVCLKQGDEIPADGIFVDGDDLVVDGGVLDSGSNPFLFFGSKVTRGNGRMLVTSVGSKTKLVKVLGGVKVCESKDKDILEARIEKIVMHCDHVLLAISVLVLVVLTVRLLGTKHENDDGGTPEVKGEVLVKDLKELGRTLLKPGGVIRLLAASVIAVVIALQHGFPLVITVSLSYWRDRAVSDHKVSPQSLSACGTMGLVSVMCLDITNYGSLCKEVVVDKFLIGEKDVRDEDEDIESSHLVLETLSHGIGLHVLVPENPVSPIDQLLFSLLKSRMVFPEERSFVLHDRKNCSKKKCTGILMRVGEDDEVLHAHWKGEASAVLSMCSHYYDCRGERHEIQNLKSELEQLIKDMEETGLGAIGYAYKKITEGQEFSEEGLDLLALISLKYICTDEAKSAVEDLKKAGAIIKLVSKGELFLARAMAYGLGILKPGTNFKVLDGEEFGKLNPKESVNGIAVMARSATLDKHLMVRSLKDNGHVVAFCGGSTIGDAAAIKEADVGITVQSQCTKLPSDIVISLEGGFNSLAPMLANGKCLYYNIQKFFQLQLTASVSGALITLIATMGLGDSSITLILLLWVNFMLIILGGSMLIMNPPSPRLIQANPPATNRSESLVNKIMWRQIIMQVLYQSVVLLAFEYKGQALPGIDQNTKKAIIFNTFALCQIFNLFNVMEFNKKEVYQLAVQKKYIWLSVGLVAVTHFMAIEFALNLAYNKRLSWILWAFCFIFGVLPWGIDRTGNAIYNYLKNCSWISSASSSHLGSNRRPSRLAYIIGVPFSMFLLISFWDLPIA